MSVVFFPNCLRKIGELELAATDTLVKAFAHLLLTPFAQAVVAVRVELIELLKVGFREALLC